MKKKLKISESQAQYILRLSEDLDPGNPTSSDTGKFACGKKHTNPPTIGCIGPGSFTMGQPGIQAVYPTLLACQNDPECGGDNDDPCEPPEPADGCPQGTVWQGQPICDCVPHLGGDSCEDNPNEDCFWCHGEYGTSCVPVGTNLSYAITNGYTLYQTPAACAIGEPECGGDPHTGDKKVWCACCDSNGGNVGVTPAVATAADCATTNFGPGMSNCQVMPNPYVPFDCGGDHNTNTSRKCERCDHPLEFRLNGACIKCIEDPNNPGCCKEDGRTNTSGTDGCPEVECKNPNHVQVVVNPGPPVECECQCPEGVGQKGCKKGSFWSTDQCCCEDTKTGDCVPDNTSVVGPPLQSENKTELNEEIKRIKQLLK